jgi:hypothetical protein
VLDATSSQAQFFETLPVACYACESSGTITGYNRPAVELWGRQPEPGDRFTGAQRLYDTRGNALTLDAIPTAFLIRWALSQRNQELVIEKPNGNRVTVLSNVAPLLDAAGTITGAVEVLQDITDRRWSEDARRVAERLSACARVAADVARQIKAPLLSMTNLLDRLREDSTLSAQARGYAELARGELVHFDKLIKQMSYLARPA